MMLTRVEDAFRKLKSDLGLRPNRHHKENRAKIKIISACNTLYMLAAFVDDIPHPFGGCPTRSGAARKDHAFWNMDRGNQTTCFLSL